jgi:putative ABC transport system ATP-binding protein
LGNDIYETEMGKVSSEDERAEFRKQYVGMVYQQPNWIKSLTVLENVAFPLSLMGMEKARRNQTAINMLQTMEMTNWANYVPAQLSSGQQQKVALARALVADPKVIIADEPTGNLDFDSGQELMKILTKLNRDGGKTVIMVTHDLEYLDFAHTAVRMFNGEIVGTYTGEGKKELFKTIDGKRGNGGKHV